MIASPAMVPGFGVRKGTGFKTSQSSLHHNNHHSLKHDADEIINRGMLPHTVQPGSNSNPYGTTGYGGGLSRDDQIGILEQMRSHS